MSIVSIKSSFVYNTNYMLHLENSYVSRRAMWILEPNANYFYWLYRLMHCKSANESYQNSIFSSETTVQKSTFNFFGWISMIFYDLNYIYVLFQWKFAIATFFKFYVKISIRFYGGFEILTMFQDHVMIKCFRIRRKFRNLYSLKSIVNYLH